MAWNPPRFVLPEDLRIHRRLEEAGLLREDFGFSPFEPEPGAALAALEIVARTGRGRFGDIHGPVLSFEAARAGRFVWRAASDGSQRLSLEDDEGRPLTLLPIDPPAWADAACGAVGPLATELPSRLVAALARAPAVPPEAAEQVARALGALRTARPPAPRAPSVETVAGVRPVPVLRLFSLAATRFAGEDDGRGAATEIAALELSFDYGGRAVPALPPEDPRFTEGERVIVLRRDRAAEAAAVARLKKAHAVPVPELDLQADAGGRLVFGFDDWDLDENAAGRFAAQALPELTEAGWRIEIAPSWPYRFYDGPVAVRAEITEGDGDWFSVGLLLQAGDQTLDMAPLILSIVRMLPVSPEGTLPEGFDVRAFLEGKALWQRLPDGGHARLEPATLAPLVSAFLTAHRLFEPSHGAEAGAVAELAEALEGCGTPFVGGAQLIALGRSLRQLAAAPPVEAPAGLNATLRPYQKTGFGWLRALARSGFGGVLADDMGLGKTVQTLALLADRCLARRADRPSLLIAPTSLVGGWRAEAERFAPKLDVLTLHGPERKRDFERMMTADLVISTYPLLRWDSAALSAQKWDMVILDEAQAVKNPATAAARAIRGLTCRARLALTGTPVENSLDDLWALYDWLIPGLLGDRRSFRQRYRTPIEREGDGLAQAALNARVRPFLLRRTKAEVAAELPEKTEITVSTPLGERQRALYETIRLTVDRRVREAIAARGLAASRITILDALLKLRQVCCDPALLKNADADGVGSAKRARLMELLEALITEGRRVLVFSQFTAMLRLIEADVKARGWDYAWLTGQTRKRAEVVSDFETGAAPIFLISLKAGGVGLNLTAADTVILYDPWWNPAVERQAMDRAHRIGQKRAVFVYRLVAAGSVEEAIARMQAKKQAVADALLDEGASGPLDLGPDDLAALLAPLDP